MYKLHKPSDATVYNKKKNCKMSPIFVILATGIFLPMIFRVCHPFMCTICFKLYIIFVYENNDYGWISI